MPLAPGPVELPGVARAAEGVSSLLERRRSGDGDSAADPRERGQPFASTGPHGHRERMRDKLLERGAEALADYELLEMLLFFAQPQGRHQAARQGPDKPLRQLRLGARRAQRELFAAPGLGRHSVAAIRLVQASAQRLALAEVMNRPVLNNWDRLMEYLHTRARAGADRAVPRAVSRQQEPPAGRRGAGARHGQPHAGLSARGGQARAGAARDRAHPGAQPPERRPDAVATTTSR